VFNTTGFSPASWLRRSLEDRLSNKGPVQVAPVASGAIMRACSSNATRVKQTDVADGQPSRQSSDSGRARGAGVERVLVGGGAKCCFADCRSSGCRTRPMVGNRGRRLWGIRWLGSPLPRLQRVDRARARPVRPWTWTRNNPGRAGKPRAAQELLMGSFVRKDELQRSRGHRKLVRAESAS
jgi:hypothetical protein